MAEKDFSWGYHSVGEWLLSLHRALGSIPGTEIPTERGKERQLKNEGKRRKRVRRRGAG